MRGHFGYGIGNRDTGVDLKMQLIKIICLWLTSCTRPTQQKVLFHLRVHRSIVKLSQIHIGIAMHHCMLGDNSAGDISFNNFAGSGKSLLSVDAVLWRGAGTCSWFTTMTLNTIDTTERLTNHYFLNKLQQLILFLSDDTQHFSICVVDSSGIELS